MLVRVAVLSLVVEVIQAMRGVGSHMKAQQLDLVVILTSECGVVVFRVAVVSV